MNRYLLVVYALVLLILPGTALAATYGPTSYTADGVQVFVQIEGPETWTSPFGEDVEVELGVTPFDSTYVNVSVTQVVIALQSRETGGSYSLLAADTFLPSSPATGAIHVNLTREFFLSGSGNGLECYFSLTVVGYYHNGTGSTAFSASSPDNLVGPFIVLPSISSPQSLVGIVAIAAFVLVVVLGAYGVKRSRSTSGRRKSLG